MRAALLLSLFVVVPGCALPASDVETASAGLASDRLAGVPFSTAVDLTRWSGEPSILALSDGTLLITGAGGMTRYATDPADIVGNAGQSYLWRSTDGGATWSFLDLGLPAPVSALLPYRNAIAGVEGDLAEDEAGRAYFVDLAAIAGNGLSASDDGGATWTGMQNPLVGQPGSDRPWVSAYGDGVVYVKYLAMSSGHRVARSTDGGLTFPDDVGLPACGQGAPVADLVAREIVIPCANGDDLSFLRTAEGAMTWEVVDVLTAGGPANNVFVSMAVAQSGHYVFAWSESHEGGATLRVASSTDRGVTWSEPHDLSLPDRTGVFPWVDANAYGAVSVVWYEADQAGAPDEIDASWFPMHAGLTLDPATGVLSAGPITALAAEPVHRGAICTSGLGCVLAGRSEDRRLLDFFEVDVDAAGVAHVTWTNTQTDVPTIWYGQVTREVA